VRVYTTIQYAVNHPDLPARPLLRHWVKAALQGQQRQQARLTIRIVDEGEGTALNEQWRHKSGPTNVLSFPSDGLEMIAPDVLGDIVICAPVVAREAVLQGKSLLAHWAHLVIHGVLHLLGYDHIEEAQALQMEALETAILQNLGYPDPYQPISDP
jgi:probable rRNA maturation factor